MIETGEWQKSYYELFMCSWV